MYAGRHDGDPSIDDFAPGLNKVGDAGALGVTLLVADPTAVIKGDNQWTVRIDDAGGAPLSGLSMEVIPWMPAHNHGVNAIPPVAPGPGPGEYQLGPFDLHMSGFWEVGLDVFDATGLLDRVSIDVCVPG